MASEILMPRLGWTMEEGTFGEWLKKDGDVIQPGDLLFTVEGDKATQEVEGFENGILRLPPNAAKAGDIFPVGALLAYVVQVGEAAPFAASIETRRQGDGSTELAEVKVTGLRRELSRTGQGAETSPGSTEAALNEPKIENRKSQIENPTSSPRARRVAKELGVDWTQINGSGRTGRIVERDVRASAAQKPAEARLRISPLAQRMAQEAGIDVAALAQQQGIDKIDRSKIATAIAERTPVPDSALRIPHSALPITRIRRLTAERMIASLHTTAAVTLTTEADATEFVALREQLKAAFAPRHWIVPAYNDLLIRLTALALQEHSLLNASWGENEIITHQEMHIGLAVDTGEGATEGGLLVPVIRNAEAKSVRQIASESRTLIEKAQARQLSPDDMQGGTFTITNLGMYNIDAFTPVINLPQCAILGVGRIHKKPAVVNDQVVVRSMMALSLTFDHRIVDGAPAARFLDQIRQYVEEPALWLVA